MTATDLFRLRGQSVGVYAPALESRVARLDLLRLAEEDGYEVHRIPHTSLVATIQDIFDDVEDRLRQNPQMEEWPFGGRKLHYMMNASSAALTGSARAELGRAMRLSPYTGVSIAVEGVTPPPEFYGLRILEGTYSRQKDTYGKFRWRPRTLILGEDEHDDLAGDL